MRGGQHDGNDGRRREKTRRARFSLLLVVVLLLASGCDFHTLSQQEAVDDDPDALIARQLVLDSGDDDEDELADARLWTAPDETLRLDPYVLAVLNDNPDLRYNDKYTIPSPMLVPLGEADFGEAKACDSGGHDCNDSKAWGDGQCAVACATTEGGTVKAVTTEITYTGTYPDGEPYSDTYETTTFEYTPAPGFRGADAFRYRICDHGWTYGPWGLDVKKIHCDDAYATVLVGPTTVRAVDDEMTYGQRILTADVVANDIASIGGVDLARIPGVGEGSDRYRDEEAYTIEYATTSRLGGSILAGWRSARYTAPPGGIADSTDSFTYTICTGASLTNEACATGTIVVKGAPRATTTTTTTTTPDRRHSSATTTSTSTTSTTSTTAPSTTTTTAAPADTDSDGVPDSTDNCPTTANASQADRYGTSAGDACEVPDALQITVNDNSFPNVNHQAYAYGPDDTVDFQLTSHDPDDVCTFFIDRDLSFTRNGTEAGHPIDDGFIDDNTDTVDDNPNTLTFSEDGFTPGSTVYYRCEEHPLTMFGPIDIL